MKTRTILVLILTGVVIVGALAGCRSSGPASTPVAPTNGVLEVEMRNFVFEPDRQQFEVGEAVEFRLLSVDDPHSYTVRGLDVNWIVPKSEEPQVQSFTFDRAGTFRLVCIIPGHESSGMVGTITVVE